MLSNTALPPVRPRATDKDAALANTARVFGGPFVVRRVRVPRRADRRQPLSVELPQPVEPGRLLGAQSLRTDERGYLMLPEVRVPGSFGLPRRPHASFPTLRIDDPTSEHALHQDLEHARLWEARVHAGEAFYGLRWEFAGLERPHFGAELFCDELARSLSLQKLIFTRKEFEVFGLRELRPDHFIRTDAGFFRPTGVGTRGSALRGAARQLDAATLKSCSEQLNKLVAGASAKLLDVFRDWDLDHNGRIDMKELHQALKLLGYDAPKNELRELFRGLGGNDDGWLEYGDLKRALTQAGDGMRMSWHAGWSRSSALQHSSSESKITSRAVLSSGGAQLKAARFNGQNVDVRASVSAQGQTGQTRSPLASPSKAD